MSALDDLQEIAEKDRAKALSAASVSKRVIFIVQTSHTFANRKTGANLFLSYRFAPAFHRYARNVRALTPAVFLSKAYEWTAARFSRAALTCASN